MDKVLVRIDQGRYIAVMNEGPNISFKDRLRAELLARCRSNPRYSLRSFARFLELEPSFLSKLLSGKRRFTEATLRKLALKLKLDPEQIVEMESGSWSASYDHLELEQFKAISDWYHYAILELMRIPGAQLEERYVSTRLGISRFEARDAIGRLLKLKLILTDDHGNIEIASNTTLDNRFTDLAFQNLQTQLLNKAIEAMQSHSLDRRDQTSMTMAIHVDRIAEAKKMITNFRRKLSEFLETGEQPDEVYQLVISLFPTRTESIERAEE